MTIKKRWVSKLERLNGREMKTLFVLSIVLPVGLLATLRMTGILPDSVRISETITLEAMRWEFQRPASAGFKVVEINRELVAASTSASLRVNLSVSIYEYVQSVSGDDYLLMGLAGNATLAGPHGFLEGVNVAFGKDLRPSTIDWQETYFDLRNLSLESSSDGLTNGEAYAKAFVQLAGLNHPNEVYFSGKVVWFLITPATENHEIELTCEITYFDGSAHRKLTQPYQLMLAGV
jgi:hypothetical protein